MPSLVASDASIVAIFAVRITDGAGSPARERVLIVTSLSQPRFSALVIITTQIKLCLCCRSGIETTRAGRDCRVDLSVYGNGTLTTSPWLKVAIRLPVRRRIPLAKRSEWVIALRDVASLHEEHSLSADFVNKFVPFLEFQRRPNWLWNRRLSLARQFAGDHGPPEVRRILTVWKFLTRVKSHSVKKYLVESQVSHPILWRSDARC